jgi:hypothetical protein
MDEALPFFKTYELWIYAVLGLGSLYFIAKFVGAWEELRRSAFGLERESAQARLNQAASILAVLIMLAITEFALVTFIIPSVPGANPLASPTLDLLATPTGTLGAPGVGGAGAQATLAPAPASLPANPGCTPGQVMLTQPQADSTVQGIVQILGSANIPNFGFYKFEIARPGEDSWLSIQAGNTIVPDGQLGNWDTSRLDPGAYQLRLVVTDNQGQSLPACVIGVTVVPPDSP